MHEKPLTRGTLARVSATLGFVGLGTMGEPMAGHLAGLGNPLYVWNRTPGKSSRLESLGAKSVGSISDLGELCDFVFLCVNRTEDVEECLTGLTQRAKPGAIFVDHSTISPTGAKNFHKDLEDKGLRFVDAPVTGGSMGAQAGTLTIFCGGDAGTIEQVRPFLARYGKRVERVGGPGAGQMAKMSNQIAVGGALLALCESLSFAKKAGLDVAQIRELVGSGAGGSWAFANYGPKILESDWSPGFSVKNQRKDFGYCLSVAEEIDAALPGTQLVDRLLSLLEDEGHGEWTTAALYEIMMRMDASS